MQFEWLKNSVHFKFNFSLKQYCQGYIRKKARKGPFLIQI